ncbi:hypothetical protein Dimus_023276, partial [Dionaea muscipula]
KRDQGGSNGSDHMSLPMLNHLNLQQMLEGGGFQFRSSDGTSSLSTAGMQGESRLGYRKVKAPEY